MLSAEMQHSAKALIVKLDGGCTSDDAECVRMLAEVTFGDSAGETALSSLSNSERSSLLRRPTYWICASGLIEGTACPGA